MPYFGEGPDAEAISTRLAVFDTQPLPQVRRSCTRWMCKNCMTVFHYCADKLKNEPLFSETMMMIVILMVTTLMKALNIMNMTKQMTTCSTFMKYLDSTFHRKASSMKLQVPLKRLVLVWFQLDEMLDTSFLLHDESHTELWQRDNKHLIYDGDTNSRDYNEAVLLLAAGRYKRADYCENDLHRFQIRERNNWSGVDGLYDAC